MRGPEQSRLTIKQPAGRGDEEVDTLAQLLGLCPTIGASNHNSV